MSNTIGMELNEESNRKSNDYEKEENNNVKEQKRKTKIY